MTSTGDTGEWDFFVSYTQADRAWAEWIAWILEEEEGYRVLVQAWDFVPGSNWTLNMHTGVTQSTRTIAVLSSAYLDSVFGTAEWLEAWRQDPTGDGRKLICVRVEKCERPGLLASVVSVDVFGRAESRAEEILRQAVTDAIVGRRKPSTRPGFPGATRAITRQAKFPGAMPTVWNVAARNVNFTGRDEELSAIEQKLSSGATLTVHSLHGMGGVGKTQLAIEYANTRAGKYDLVWSIAAEEPTAIPDQFAKLVRELGLEPSREPEDLRAQVHRQLTTVVNWLLIFDNADDVEDIRPWIPTVPRPQGRLGHVIVTTRRTGFSALGTVLDLDVIDAEAAVRVLQARAPRLDDAEAEQIAEALGRLPLALEQAAAFLEHTTTITPAEYLHILRASPAKIMSEGQLPANVRNVATVWTLSMDRVHDEKPAAMQLLDIAAYLAPESIPLDLFTTHPERLPQPLAGVVTDSLAFHQTVATLVDFSLVKHTPTGLQIHRLVQAAVRARHQTHLPAAMTGEQE